MEISPRKKKKVSKQEFDSRVDSEYTTENAKKNFRDDDSEYKFSEKDQFANEDEISQNHLDKVSQHSQSNNNKKQFIDQELLNFLTSYEKLSGERKVAIISDLFYGKDNATMQGIKIYQTNKGLLEELNKNQEYRKALESALPTFSYEDIIKCLKSRYPEISFDQKREFDVIKDLISMYRDKRDNIQVNFSKLTPLEIKRKIEDNKETMELEELLGLQQLLNMDQKLRDLKLRQQNYDFFEKKNRQRDQADNDHLERIQVHKKRLQIIKKNSIAELFKTEAQSEKQEQIKRLSYLNSTRDNNNYGNNFSEYIKLFMVKYQDKWEQIKKKKREQEIRDQQSKLRQSMKSPRSSLKMRNIQSVLQKNLEESSCDTDFDNSRLLSQKLKQAEPKPMNFTQTLQDLNTKRYKKSSSEQPLRPALIQGSILELFPKYGLLLNKKKLPFFELNKFSKDIKAEQIETHQRLVLVNKQNVKKGLKLKELAETDDPNVFYKNYGKQTERGRNSNNTANETMNNKSIIKSRRGSVRTKDSYPFTRAEQTVGGYQSTFFEELTRSKYVGSKYEIMNRGETSRPMTQQQQGLLNPRAQIQLARNSSVTSRVLSNFNSIPIKIKEKDLGSSPKKTDQKFTQDDNQIMTKRISLLDLGKRSFQKEMVQNVIKDVMSKRKPY
ncbi:UNKNOWN [Stylonychia lemnae]|uniref:Uncharacterized protein n=1 Tax=Stylonychia lemnae TaxID=5949 RepID=A0A077ZX70_STYLE|nr:UNKNOWN [Stylonychia lemnae]|eukprot:CDW73126.1 UNKNOWN [Stylonychia lemnae]